MKRVKMVGMGFNTDADLVGLIYAYTTASGFVQAKGTTPLSLSTWYSLAGVFTDATHKDVFINGTNEATLSTSIAMPPVDNTTIGRLSDSSPGSYFEGHVAEARISDIARSDAWLKATYHTLTNRL